MGKKAAETGEMREKPVMGDLDEVRTDLDAALDVRPMKIDQPVFTLRITIDDGTAKVVKVPRMTKAAFELFKSLLDIYESAIVADQRTPESPDQLSSA